MKTNSTRTQSTNENHTQHTRFPLNFQTSKESPANFPKRNLRAGPGLKTRSRTWVKLKHPRHKKGIASTHVTRDERERERDPLRPGLINFRQTGARYYAIVKGDEIYTWHACTREINAAVRWVSNRGKNGVEAGIVL